MRKTIRNIAIARSGDKGNRATLSVIAHDLADYPLLAQTLSRYTLPALGALQFVLHDALAGGVTRSLALDAHGKTLCSAVLSIGLPDELP